MLNETKKYTQIIEKFG